MKTYYFGCKNKNDLGHYLFDPTSYRHYRDKVTPWEPNELDTGLAPKTAEYQQQSAAKLHVKDGWTAIGMWDRSADKRYASNAAFVAEGEHSFEEMVRLFAEHFPEQHARIAAAAPITEVGHGDQEQSG